MLAFIIATVIVNKSFLRSINGQILHNWYAFTKLREDQKIACDATTIKYFGANSSKDYADTLIKLLESYVSHPNMANLADHYGSKSLQPLYPLSV